MDYINISEPLFQQPDFIQDMRTWQGKLTLLV